MGSHENAIGYTSSSDHTPTPLHSEKSGYYPYGWANPDVWRSASALVETGAIWMGRFIRRQAEEIKYESGTARLTHAGKIMGAGAWALYPFVSDAINVGVARATGNPFIAPALTTIVDLPVLYTPAKLAELSEKKKYGLANNDNDTAEESTDETKGHGNQNILPWTDEYKTYSNSLDRLVGREERYNLTPVMPNELDKPDKSQKPDLRPEDRSLVAKALSPVMRHVNHGEALTTTLFAGSQVGEAEELLKITQQNELKSKQQSNIEIPNPTTITLKHALAFGGESFLFALLAAKGHDGGAVQGIVDLGLHIGLPVFIVDRALSYGFNVKPDKSLSYQGYEKIVDMVRSRKEKVRNNKNRRSTDEEDWIQMKPRVDPPQPPDEMSKQVDTHGTFTEEI